MFCQNNCKIEANFVCLKCNQLYCTIHGEKHLNELDHVVQLANDEIKSKMHNEIMEKALKIEKCKRIHQIFSNTFLAISNLEQISQMQINSVKNVKNFDDFTQTNFDLEKHLLCLVHSGIIDKGVYKISNENIAELTLTRDQYIEEIENLKSIIKNLEGLNGKIKAEVDQKIVICDQFQKKIDDLESENLSIIESLHKIQADKKREEKRIQESIQIQIHKGTF